MAHFDPKDKSKEEEDSDLTNPHFEDEYLGTDDGSLDWEVEDMLETIGLSPKEIPMDRVLYEGWI